MKNFSDKLTILQKYFGYSTFRLQQEYLIDCVLNGRDVLCVMPTGAGKSLCYQVPALMLQGLTVVISPLISLMKDQVSSLREMGVPCAYLNSTLDMEEYKAVMTAVEQGKIKLLYVAPERLVSETFLTLMQRCDVAFVAVDEAHCISHWGQDFRPSYLKIKALLETLNHRPIVAAYTATATEQVKQDIIEILQLQNPVSVTTGFDRPNLFFQVKREGKKNEVLLSILSAKQRQGQSGIVYCASRNKVEEVCALLKANGFQATRYHAGLSSEERRENQEAFIYERSLVMVATCAFGMGIDKSNVRFVIHYNMPKDVESYYQEAGRAGRDGLASDCILLYSPGDVRINELLLARSNSGGETENPDYDEKTFELIKAARYERLKQMTFYCTTNQCLRKFLLKYFGEEGHQYCGNCENCLSEFEEKDYTIEAQKILSCIVRTGQRFGAGFIIDVLRGSREKRILQNGFDKLSTYNLMSEYSSSRLKDIVSALLEKGLVVKTADEYPKLVLNQKSVDILNGKLQVVLKLPKEREKRQTDYDTESRKLKFTNSKSSLTESQQRLFEALKTLRLEIAREENMPAYIVFSDAALLDMCIKMPKNEQEFLQVSGVGEVKLEKYGKAFLAKISSFEE